MNAQDSSASLGLILFGFAGAAYALLIASGRIRAHRGMYAWVCQLNPAISRRIIAAADRRFARIGTSFDIRQMWLAAQAAVLSWVCAALMLFAHVHYWTIAAILYPLFAIQSLIAAYRPTETSSPRVAGLTPRRSTDVVKWWWFALALVTGGGVLVSGFPNGIVICAATFAIVAAAWRISTRPAVISAEDPPAERLIDTYKRRHQTFQLLFFATIVACVGLMNVIDDKTLYQELAILATIIAQFAISIGYFTTSTARPSVEELAEFLDDSQMPATRM